MDNKAGRKEQLTYFGMYIAKRKFMIKMIEKIILVVSGILIVTSCQNFNPVYPPPELDVRGRFGEYIDTTFEATADTFIVDYKTDTKYSTKLSVGEYQGFSAGFLIRFTKLAITDNPMDSIRIRLTPKNTFGNQSGTMTINAYVVEDDWDESANTDDFWHTPPTMELASSQMVDAEDTNAVYIAINDTALIHRWQREGEDNKGLFIQLGSSDPGFIREFVSFKGLSTYDWPTMYYRVKKDTVFTIDSTNVGKAAAIYNYSPSAGQDVFEIARNTRNLVVSSGIQSRVFIRFDQLLEIPNNVIMQAADLSLYVNDESFTGVADSNEMVNKDHSAFYNLRLVTDADESFEWITVDSSFTSNTKYSLLLRQEDGKLYFPEEEQVKFGTSYIQDIVNEIKEYKWFQIQYQNEYNDISVVRLFNRFTSTPQLHVRYYRVDTSGL